MELPDLLHNSVLLMEIPDDEISKIHFAIVISLISINRKS